MDMRVLEREVRERTGDRAAGISIDQVRALQPLLQSTPALSPWRAIIVDSIDDLARAAANALLKSLERSEESRVGKECVSTCRSRWAREHEKKKKITIGYRDHTID